MVWAQQLWRGLCSKPTLTPVGKGLGEPQLAHTGTFLIEFILNWDAQDNLAEPRA